MKDKNKSKGKAPVSKPRRILFGFIMALIPVLFLVGAEFLLRAVGYGESYPLVYKKKIFDRERYVVNRQIGQRYFSLPVDKIPEASEDYFDIVKKPKTLRIFCLGGSTTAGFPYEINATFPFQLKYRLKEALVGNNVEVINLGISAINSYTVLDLLPEILELKPDLLIIYMGHNEFYGAYGVGSSQYISANRLWVSTYLKLRRLRLMQLIRNTIAAVKKGSASEKVPEPESMMQAMARDQEIPPGSEKFRLACENFSANLTEIIQKAKQKNVQVLVSNLVSNLKGQKPFVSKFSPNLDEFTRQRCETLLLEGRGFVESAEYDKALQTFGQISSMDSSAAELHYYMGQAYTGLGDTLKAYAQYAKARDLDQLRFRAPTAFNQIIQNVARQEDIPLVDMERIFAAASPGGIPGKELLLEHLHPNFNGYRLMAQAFLEALRTIQVINPPEPIAWKEELFTGDQIHNVIKEFPRDSAGVTDLDIEFGQYRIFFLTHRWPYPEKTVTMNDYIPHGSEITKKIAFKHFSESTYWDEAHYELASYYLKEEQFGRALREYRAVYIAFPDNYYPTMKMGDVLVLQQQYSRAKRYYDISLEKSPRNPFVLAKLGNLFVFGRQFQEAVKYLAETVKADSAKSVLNNSEKTNIQYLMGVSYANLKDWKNAEKALGEALRLTPHFEPAEKLGVEMKDYISKQGRQ